MVLGFDIVSMVITADLPREYTPPVTAASSTWSKIISKWVSALALSSMLSDVTVLVSFFLQEFKNSVDVIAKIAAVMRVILFFMVFDLRFGICAIRHLEASKVASATCFFYLALLCWMKFPWFVLPENYAA